MSGLRGRAREVRLIEEFLDAVAVGPKVLLLAGDPGIGKSALWQGGLDSARDRGVRVLAHRAVEAEAVLSFAGVSELLVDVVDDVLPRLGDLRRHALEAALLLHDRGDEPVDPRAIALAFLDSLRTLAVDAPVLVAVDDFQWLDSMSARTLAFALRRLKQEPVGALLTLRGDADVHPGLRDMDRIVVGPLEEQALAAVVKHRLGLELSGAQLRQLADGTGGNPFFGLEIARELVARPGSPGRPLRVPSSLRKAVGERLATLSTTTRQVLLLAAVLGRPTVTVLTAACADPAVAIEGLEHAAEAGVVELDDDRVRFVHPLMASVCYAEAPPWRRREAHARLADVVGDEEERARHLALSVEAADASVAAVLDHAALRALVRGAPAAAAELNEIAAQLTPAGEPPVRRRRRLAAAEAHRLAGDGQRAATILDELLAEAPHGAERGDVLFALARVRRAELPTITRWCESALAEAGEDQGRSAEILAFLSWMRLLEGRVRNALEHGRAALEHAERADDQALLARAIARVAMAETWTLESTPGLLERGVTIEQSLPRPLEFHESPRVTLARRLMCHADFDAARPLLAAADDGAKASGDEATRAHVLFHRFQVEWFVGRWPTADRCATEAIELAEQLGDEQYTGIALYARSLIDAHLGRAEAASVGAASALAVAEALSDELFGLQSRTVLGFLELSRGNAAAADGHLRALPAWLDEHGWAEPTDFAWINAIEAMIGVADLEEARVWLTRYEDLATRSTSPWALATAARGRGLLAAAEGDLDAARGSLARALAEHDRMCCPFERARTLLAIGAVRRRGREKRAAREALMEALEVFDRLDARLWAGQARAEIERISGRRAASGELTETERQLAHFAAEGLANKEIAAALHISVHTVEAHLTRIYRKLDIRSRAALATRVVSGPL
jgi:DNA-binding CsgD family transcriptional regulator